MAQLCVRVWILNLSTSSSVVSSVKAYAVSILRYFDFSTHITERYIDKIVEKTGQNFDYGSVCDLRSGFPNNNTRQLVCQNQGIFELEKIIKYHSKVLQASQSMTKFSERLTKLITIKHSKTLKLTLVQGMSMKKIY